MPMGCDQGGVGVGIKIDDLCGAWWEMRTLVKKADCCLGGPLGIDRRDAKECLLGKLSDLTGELYGFAALRKQSLMQRRVLAEISVNI